MKTLFRITLILFVLNAFQSCSKDDTPEPEVISEPDSESTPEPENQAPSQVNLMTPEAAAQNIDVSPTFRWEAATNPDGDQIFYEIYADTTTSPSTLIGTTGGTSLELVERLSLLENYYWKVVAKDGKGGESESATQSFETRNLFFSNATQNANFPGRSAFSSTVFNNQVWLSGGFHNSTVEGFRTNDVWSSENGVNWTLATSNAQWSRRINHTMTAFKNKLWVIGGSGTEGQIGDVWNSDDGINWILVTDSPGFGALSNHTTIVFYNKLYVMHNGKVWFSEDGIVWTLASDGEIGRTRKRHTALVYNDKLWILGGSDLDDLGSVLSSSDGITWEIINNGNPPFSDSNIAKRSGHTSVVYDGKMWVIGGFGDPGGDDIWFSIDGTSWALASENSAFSKRTSHECQIFNDQIWLFGGEEFNGNERKNDVWFIN